MEIKTAEEVEVLKAKCINWLEDLANRQQLESGNFLQVYMGRVEDDIQGFLTQLDQLEGKLPISNFDPTSRAS